jgi:two-component system, sensor histidine kinase YesM
MGMRFFSSWYLNLPIRNKLLLWFLPLILFTIAITGYFSYHIASQQVFSKVQQNQENLLKKNIDQFILVDQETNNFINYLFLSSSVQELLTSEEPSLLLQQTYSSLSKVMVTRPMIHSLIIYNYDDIGTSQSPLAINQTGITSAKTYDFFLDSPQNDHALRDMGESGWYLSKPKQSLFIGDKQHKFVKARIIKNVYSLVDEGLVVVGINEEFIRSNFLNTSDEDTQLYIVNKDGLILTASNSKFVGKKINNVKALEPYHGKSLKNAQPQIITEDSIISYKPANQVNLHFIIVQSKESVLFELKQIQTFTLLVLIICFMTISLMSIIAAGRLTRPMQKLINSMLEVQKGDFSQSVEFTGRDEIGQLGQRYDQMVKQINTLIHDVYHSKLQQRNAELKTLQAQINPHFLYNTLNTICWTAQRKEQQEIADMTYALSKVFRITLNDGKDFLTIKEELELVNNYLYLQKMRFNPEFAYEIEVKEEMENYSIPKLLIQPFIENSVIHGIEPSNESGFIKISAFVQSDTAIIEIIDNGVGMDERLLTTFRRTLHFQNTEGFNRLQGTGYAIHNVKERLHHVYGDKANIYFHSIQGRGTRVEIHLPLENEMEVCS